MIFGKATPGSKVWLDDTAVMVSPQGLFVIGFGRDETGTRTLRVEPQQFEAWEGDLTVRPREYDIERVDGLPPRTVTPDPEAAERIRQEGAMVSSARNRRDERTDFAASFEWILQP